MVVLWRLRYKLSLRDLVEMFTVRSYIFSHETVRDWEARFATLLTTQLSAKRRGQTGKSWYVDETYLKVKGAWCYLYRAIDRDGNLVDTILSERYFPRDVWINLGSHRITNNKSSVLYKYMFLLKN